MQFRICGADRETGEDEVFVIEATTAQEARQKANAVGFLVSSVTPVPAGSQDGLDQPTHVARAAVQPSQVERPSTPAASSDPANGTVAGLGALLGALIGWLLLGCFGIAIGGFLGMVFTLGVLAPLFMSPEMRRERAPRGLAIFTGSTIICLAVGIPVARWWHDIWSPDNVSTSHPAGHTLTSVEREELERKRIAAAAAAEKAFTALLSLDDSSSQLIEKVSVSADSDLWTATITVKNVWHLRHKQLRLQDAQNLQRAWATLVSKNDPDKAPVRIVDLNGNEVGGSRMWGGRSSGYKINWSSLLNDRARFVSCIVCGLRRPSLVWLALLFSCGCDLPGTPSLPA